MSDSEEENYCFFGKPLEPYDEDAFPKKKPISLEDQIATDAQGRRRFHGAFTGGFSAGFFNTVGSLEGWTPSEFKSTRQDKAKSRSQKPEDFMDDEDIGEFGIAPQTVRATKDYSTTKKRKRQIFTDGPIPGEPLLHSLLTSGNETIGYLLLRNIGLKAKEQKSESPDNKVYGCEMPKTYEISRHEDVDQYMIPDIYKEFIGKSKDNSFGLGYVGLDKTNVNLFTSSKLVINERNKKKLSISGQAFGVGAFEEDDDDIYVKEDMSKYDFELTSEKATKKTPKKDQNTVFDSFIRAGTVLSFKEVYPPPTIPHSFTGKHKVKKSRFEPLPTTPTVTSRKDMTPEVRGKFLNEDTVTLDKSSSNQVVTDNVNKEVVPLKQDTQEVDSAKSSNLSAVFPGLVFDRFVSASQPEDTSNILEVVTPSKTSHGSQEMRDAARMKMFGPLTRTSFSWQPNSLLCKRFNVVEPQLDGSELSRGRKRTKNLIFEYQKHSDDSCNLLPGLTVQNTVNESTASSSNISTNTAAEVSNISENNKSNVNVPQTSVELASNDEKNASKDVNSVSVTQEEPLPKDITEKIDIVKNVDLFKAVFLSSSESEDEEDKDENKNEEMKANILSDHLLPKIKPIKQGILSNMDSSIFNSINNSQPQKSIDTSENVDKASEVITSNKLIQNEPNSYGPKLPDKELINASASNLSVIKDSDDDEWVEKSDIQVKGKNHHKKKHKKHSHKKKHKHKKHR